MNGRPRALRGGVQHRLLVLACVTAALLLVDWLDVVGPLVASWTDVTVSWTVRILHILGFVVASDGTIVAHPGGFAYEIHYRCTGLRPLVFLALAIAIEHAPMRQKAAGIGVGFLLLILLNMVRLVHLFMIGVSAPQSFWYMHEIVWQIGMIAGLLLILGVWLAWARGTPIRPAKSSRGAGFHLETRPALIR